ncbi:uncharacterized protein [Tiliqua scincoides]|uniref:uncharacterized protein n=1 Tax=Tiliqua scincoides TaxID=71010 RepID=UPI0034634997
MSSLIDRHHFQSGMGELVNFAQSLLESPTDHHAREKVQRHTERASQEMQAALGVANGELRNIDNQSVKLVAEKKKKEGEKNAKNQHLSCLRNQLASYRSSESSSRNMLEAAQRHLEEMNRQVAAKRREVEQNEIIRNVGIGLMFIPIVGIIAGSVMVGCGQVALDAAEKAKREAEEAVQRHREEVSRYAAETSRLSSLIWNAEMDITNTQYRIILITSEQHSLASRQAEIIRVQDTLRKCVNFLSLLAGKVSVADDLSRDILIYEDLEHVLEDILQHVFPLMGQGNEGVMALSSAEIRGLIGKLKSAQESLRALPYTEASNAISDFA